MKKVKNKGESKDMKKDKSTKESFNKLNTSKGEAYSYNKDRRPSTLLFVFVIVLILITIAITIYFNNKNHDEILQLATEQFNQQQLILARSAAISIKNFIADVEDDLLALSKLSVVQKMEPGILEKMEILFEGTPPQTSSRRLDKDGVLRYIYPFEGWHQELVGRNYSQEPYFQKAKETGETVISSLVINEAGERRTRLVMPVYIENGKRGKEFNGVIICSFDPEILNALYISPIISGKTGYAKLLNEEGVFLAHYEKEFVGQDAFKVRAKMNPELSYDAINIIQKKMMAGEEGVGRYVSGWHRGQRGEIEKLIAYTPVHVFDKIWSVAVCAPVEEVEWITSKAYRNELFTLGFTILFLTAIGIFGFIVFFRWSQSLKQEIETRKRAEERIEKIQSLRNAISDINQLLIRAKNESELFQQICNLLIKVKGVRFVWIGLTNSENFEVKPVARAGFKEGHLSSIKVTWDDSKYGQGPTGIAIKTSQPFIMRNIEDDPKFKPWGSDALKRGYLSNIALPLIYKKETIGVLNVYSGIKDAFTKEEVKFLKEVSRDITIGISSLRMGLKLQQGYQKLKEALDATIQTMSKIVEVKDPYTAGHQQRVSQLATAVAKELNLSKDKIEGIRITSLIHDIGKIGIPAEILSKTTTLSDVEFSLIKGHSQMGYDILKSIDFSYPIANIVLQHHERMNGSGYPNKLKGDEILLEAKIISVADVVEAMSSHRPYRPALGIDAALEEISKNKGILYDPEVVDVCLRLFKEKGFKFE